MPRKDSSATQKIFIAQSSVNTELRAADVNITASTSWLGLSKAPSSWHWYPSLIMVLTLVPVIDDSPHCHLSLIMVLGISACC